MKILVHVILGLLVWGAVACGVPKQIITPQYDSNRLPLPLEASEVVAQVIEVLPLRGNVSQKAPCGQVPCEAELLIETVLITGHAFKPALKTPAKIQARFAYTLSATDSLFNQGLVKLPGLAKGDRFRAQLRIIGENSKGENLYEIARYLKL